MYVHIYTYRLNQKPQKCLPLGKAFSKVVYVELELSIKNFHDRYQQGLAQWCQKLKVVN
jgi:hypothetical protein